MATSSFADRLAYVRWLRARGRIRPETDEEFATSLGVGLPWLTKWKARDNAPNSRDQAVAIIRAIGAMGVTDTWLFDGEGEAPEPERWQEWVAARQTPKRTAKLEEPDIPAPRTSKTTKPDEERQAG